MMGIRRSAWNLFSFSAAVVGVMMACGMGRDHAVVDAGTADSAQAVDGAHAMPDSGITADPDLQRVRTADTDLAQLETGRVSNAKLAKLVDGPFMVTDLYNQHAPAGVNPTRDALEVFISDTAACSLPRYVVRRLNGDVAFSGRVFVKAGYFLCVRPLSLEDSADVMWSGFRPYPTP